MASTVWKGYVTFGLISIPIRLLVAARPERVAFHQIHKVCGSRIRHLLYCPVDDRAVERAELAKGYEYGKDRYVLVEDEGIRKIALPSTQTMEIMQFVQMKEVDPLYFDIFYFAVPEQPGRKAYQLLVETMQKTGYAALANVGMHQREYLVVIRSRSHGLTLHTMHFANEIREVSEHGDTADVQLKLQEIELAEQVIESLAAPFEPEKFHDEFQERIKRLVEAKLEGEQVVETQKPKRLAPVVDVMDALRKSISAAEKRPPASAAAARPKKARKRAARKAA